MNWGSITIAGVWEEEGPSIGRLKSVEWPWKGSLAQCHHGVPMPDPGVAPPPGFREVGACLMRDPPSLAPTEAPPETRPPNVMAGPTVATLSATWIVQDEATRVTYVDSVTTSVERVALGNPHMVANL